MAADQGNVVVDGCLGGGADRISDLPDHLLHRILIRLPSTADAACTSVLSRRWRRVWTHLPELTLRYCNPERVSAALAAWSAPVLHRLKIKIALPFETRTRSRYDYDTAEHVCSWLRFASERLAGELRLSLPGASGELVLLPVCGRFTAIRLSFVHSTPHLRFQLRPAGGVFTALAALTIRRARLESHELEEVVSSRCPRLKELVLDCIVPLSRSYNILSIRSDSLEMLRVVAYGMLHYGLHLQVATPELQELSLQCVSLDAHIIGPKLSKVCWSNSYDPKRHKLVEAGRHLKRLELTSRSLALLGRFDAVDELNLDILLPEGAGAEEYRRILEDTNKIKCEALVVRILAVSHAFEPIILHFLRKCVGIRKLVVRLSYLLYSCKLSSCPCDFAQNHLITNGIVLDSLQEVVVMGGGDDQIAKLVNLLQRCSETFQGAHYHIRVVNKTEELIYV